MLAGRIWLKDATFFEPQFVVTNGHAPQQTSAARGQLDLLVHLIQAGAYPHSSPGSATGEKSELSHWGVVLDAN